MSRPQRRGLTLPILASAVAAALLIAGVFTGAASATETPPENTVPPTMNPTTPQVGAEVIGSPGTWKGATSYAYNWFRCVPAGSCEKLTYHGKRYTPVVADVGKQLVFQVEATNSVGTTKASTTRSSKVIAAPENPPLSWYSCGQYEGSGELFSNSDCNTTGAENLFSWHRLSAGLVAHTESTTGYVLFYATSGIEYQVNCSKATGEGELQNVETGAKLNNYNLSLSSCFMTKPAGLGCVLEGNKISVNTLAASSPVAPEPLNPELKFAPGGGTEVMSYRLEGCSIPVMNGIYRFTGWFPAQVDNSSSTIIMPETSGNLKMSGVNAKFSGRSVISHTDAGGHGLKLAQ